MLIVLNIMIILFLLAMVAIWATYGFFSAFLHLMIVVVSGTFAFAVWEPLAHWLLGRMPATAWGVGLLVPFVLSIVVLRVVFDKYCKMNLKFPRIADQAGGAACGLGAGVLTAGMLLMGAGFLMPSDILGFQPYRMERNQVSENEDGQLWAFTRVDEWAGGFYTMLSAGSMTPMGGTPMNLYKADIAARAQISHLTSDINQSKVSPPGSVKVLDAHTTINPDDFLYMVVLASLEALVNTDQIDLDAIDQATDPDDRDLYGGHLVDAIMKEFDDRQAVYSGLPEDQQNADTRPTAIFNLNAMFALADKFKVPEAGSSGSPRTNSDGSITIDRSGGSGQGRTPGGETPDDGDDDADEPTDEEAAAEQEAADAEAAETALAAGGSPLNDLVAFFDDVIEKQITPTVDAVDRQLAGGNVVIVDTQWFKKPVGSFDSDGWLRVAIPSVRLVTQRVTDSQTQTESVPPIAYSLEVDQNTGERILVDLLTQNYSSAYSQVDAVKIGWVFVLPPGHSAFRFEARQLGFDLTQPVNTDDSIEPFWRQVAAIGAIDVKEQAAPPDGIQIGDTGAVVALGERLPRSISPNSATDITPNRDDDPWTAFQGTQNNILRRNSGGRRSQMRQVTVPTGSRLIHIILTEDSDQNLLAAARQGSMDMFVRDDKGAEHAPIGFARQRDDVLDISLRPTRTITADRLPVVGAGEKLYIYFQVPVGVNATELVLGEATADGIPFAQPISVVAR